MAYRSKKEIIEEKNRNSVQMYCKYCGHTNTLPAFIDKKICHWCHKLIKNETQAHFDYKLRKLLKENK